MTESQAGVATTWTAAVGHAALWPPELVRLLEENVLWGYLMSCRWFGGKRRVVKVVRLGEAVPGPWPHGIRFFVLEVCYSDEATEAYALPLAVVSPANGADGFSGIPQAVLATLSANEWVVDAFVVSAFREALLEQWERAGEGRDGLQGSVANPRAGQSGGFSRMSTRLVNVEQSNASVVVGDHFWLKAYRKLEPGAQVEVEVMSHLKEAGGDSLVPKLHGTLALPEALGGATVAVLMDRLSHKSDGWALALRCFGEGLDQVPLHQGPDDRDFTGRRISNFPNAMQYFLRRASQLGRRTGQLHLALATDDGEVESQSFSPEPWSDHDMRCLVGQSRRAIERLLRALEEGWAGLSGECQTLAVQLIEGRQKLLALVDDLRGESAAQGLKIRVHGDLHLAQVLDTGGDFVFIDFEGEPVLPMEERRVKRSALKDVAGMLRSFHYAAAAALKSRPPEVHAYLAPVARDWAELACREFMGAYQSVAGTGNFLPASVESVEGQLRVLLLEKAASEVLYELSYRPGWVDIPLRAVCSLINPGSSAVSNSL